MNRNLGWGTQLLGGLSYLATFLAFVVTGMLMGGYMGLLIGSALAGAVIMLNYKRIQYKLEDAETLDELAAVKRRITLWRGGVAAVFSLLFGYAFYRDLVNLHGLVITKNQVMLFLCFVFFGLGGGFAFWAYAQNPDKALTAMQTARPNMTHVKVKMLMTISVVVGLLCGGLLLASF